MKLSAVNYYPPELTQPFLLMLLRLQKAGINSMLDFPLATIQILFRRFACFYHLVFIAFGLVLSMTIIGILYFSGTKGRKKVLKKATINIKPLRGCRKWRGDLVGKIHPFFLFPLHKTDEHKPSLPHARTEHFRIPHPVRAIGGV